MDRLLDRPHDLVMGRRRTPQAVLWDEGPAMLSFLVDWGFVGPTILAAGLSYRRADLVVTVETWSRHHESGFDTSLQWILDSSGTRFASLDCLYVACGLGPAQDVPTGAGASHVIIKRIKQHAIALGAVLPYLDGPHAGDLFRRCQGRRLPD